MKTRTEKWARYRAKIKATPDYKFKSKPILDAATAEEKRELSDKVMASGAISIPGIARGKIITFGDWKVRRKVWLSLKIALAAILVAGLAFMWTLWAAS